MDTPTLNVSDGTQMLAHAVRPKNPKNKGIIVLQEAFGVNNYIKRIAGRFADKGYLAIAPELFHRTASKNLVVGYNEYPKTQEHMRALTEEGMVADMRAAYDWLVDEGVPATNIAVVGFCMGGRAAFLANATLPVVASVSFYGGGIAQTLLKRAEDLSAPQLLIWGGTDAHILPEHTRAVADALKKAGKAFVDITFSEAGHAFANEDRESFHESSTGEAWALADAFLENNSA